MAVPASLVAAPGRSATLLVVLLVLGLASLALLNEKQIPSHDKRNYFNCALVLIETSRLEGLLQQTHFVLIIRIDNGSTT